MAKTIWSRLWGMPRWGKYALCQLLTFGLALPVHLADQSRYSEMPLFVLGFPVMYLLWLFPGLFWGAASGLSVGTAILFVLCLMAANAYLWGRVAAFVHGRIDLQRNPPA